MPAGSLTLSVDRIEGSIVILEADDGQRFEVDIHRLAGAREGLIYRIPVDEAGTPRWTEARIDAAEAQRRKGALEERMRRLTKGDAGGDVDL